MQNNIKKLIYWTPRIIILIIAVLFFIFALLSGSEEYGGGINGVLMNSPNALPWLVLFLLVGVAWKWEKIGGWFFILFAIFSVFFFNVFKSPGVLLFVTLPILLVGILFLISSKFNKKKSKK